jgi:hypothetical protein
MKGRMRKGVVIIKGVMKYGSEGKIKDSESENGKG